MKTLAEHRTSRAGSPWARAAPATVPARAAGSASTKRRLTPWIGAEARRRGGGPPPPGARRRCREDAGGRSSGRVVEESHVEGRLAGRGDLEGHAPVADHDERGRRAR